MSNDRKIREEDRFDADLSALKREPIQCPHCGEAWISAYRAEA